MPAQLFSISFHRQFVAFTQKRTPNAIRPARLRVKAVTAELPIATDFSSPPNRAASLEIQKFLSKKGWKEGWIDGIVTEIRKSNLKTSVEQCDAVITYLMSLGMSSAAVENMVSLCKLILGRSVEELTAVTDWLKQQGLHEKALNAILIQNPTLLMYAPAGDGNCLEKGQARAAVTFGERGGTKVAGITMWREGASFASKSTLSLEEPHKA